MPFGIGLPELIVILVIILVIFGPKKIPEIGKSLGSAVRELRKSTTDDSSDKDTAEAEKKAEAKKSDE